MKSAQPSILAVNWQQAANPMTEAALYGVTRALESVGRAFIGLDSSFTIHHVSRLLDSSVSGTNAITWSNPFDLTLALKLKAYFGTSGTWWNTPREG